MTFKPARTWTPEEDALFIDLLRKGTALTIINKHFPDCTHRQIDNRTTVLCAKHSIPRPIPLKRRNPEEMARRKEAKRLREEKKAKARAVRWDFSDQNINVGRL